VHTHGAYIEGLKKGFSKEDLDMSIEKKIVVYMVNPWGEIYRFDPFAPAPRLPVKLNLKTYHDPNTQPKTLFIFKHSCEWCA